MIDRLVAGLYKIRRRGTAQDCHAHCAFKQIIWRDIA